MKIQAESSNEKPLVAKWASYLIRILLVAVLIAVTADFGLSGKYKTLSNTMGKSSWSAKKVHSDDEKDHTVFP